MNLTNLGMIGVAFANFFVGNAASIAT
jgi:hypothetical protein